jgi:hypothetical protein
VDSRDKPGHDEPNRLVPRLCARAFGHNPA